MEGIAKAKAAGAYKGRRASIDPAAVRKQKALVHLKSLGSSGSEG